MSEDKAFYQAGVGAGRHIPTEALLDDLFEARCFLDALNLRRKDALDALITPEIRSRMLTVEAEFEEPITEQVSRISEMEQAVKDRVIAEGCSTKGEHRHGVWMKGRVSWDSKALEGYAKAEPKLLAFRTEGSPSVTIRGVVAK